MSADAVVSAGDTAWVLISAALVMLMVPGLAFFYGGLVRKKSTLNTLMMSMAALGVDQRAVGGDRVLAGVLAGQSDHRRHALGGLRARRRESQRDVRGERFRISRSRRSRRCSRRSRSRSSRARWSSG